MALDVGRGKPVAVDDVRQLVHRDAVAVGVGVSRLVGDGLLSDPDGDAPVRERRSTHAPDLVPRPTVESLLAAQRSELGQVGHLLVGRNHHQ